MPSTSSRIDVFTVAFRNYWWTSTVGGLYFVVGFVMWGGTRDAILSSGVFVMAALVGMLVHYRTLSSRRVPQVALVLGHLLIGQAVLVWQQAHLPLTDYTTTGNPAARELLIYLVSALFVIAMSMFGGIWGALLGLAAHYAFIFNGHEEFSFKWVFPVLIAAAGIIVSSAFWRLDEAYRELERLAGHDHLTGLFNRHRLTTEFERLQTRAQEAARPMLLVAWDLDDLKRVNDTQGHAAGDAYIREFAEALRTTVRGSSAERDADAAFRVGGDEFISLHLQAPDGDALLARVHRTYPSVSAGWVRCETLTLDQALTRADQALYVHKDRRKQSLVG